MSSNIFKKNLQKKIWWNFLPYMDLQTNQIFQCTHDTFWYVQLYFKHMFETNIAKKKHQGYDLKSINNILSYLCNNFFDISSLHGNMYITYTLFVYNSLFVTKIQSFVCGNYQMVKTLLTNTNCQNKMLYEQGNIIT
jgi:hypothetical protein